MPPLFDIALGVFNTRRCRHGITTCNLCIPLPMHKLYVVMPCLHTPNLLGAFSIEDSICRVFPYIFCKHLEIYVVQLHNVHMYPLPALHQLQQRVNFVPGTLTPYYCSLTLDLKNITNILYVKMALFWRYSGKLFNLLFRGFHPLVTTI